jgi:DNA-binding transcriptional MerR regulator
MSRERLSFEELCGHAGIPGRTVRYYIQRGLVDRPIGETRAAYYTAKHLDQLLTVKKWSGAGLSLDRIAELILSPTDQVPVQKRHAGDVEVWSHIHIAHGIEIHLEPGRARLTPQQVRAFVRRAMAAYEEVINDAGKE